MLRRQIKFVLSASLIAVVLACCLFSGFAQRTMQVGWLRMVCGEIQAACRDAGTQWMVVVCLVSYLGTFFFLEKRADRSLKVGASGGRQQDSSRESKVCNPTRQKTISYLLNAISSPDFWLVTFVALVLLRYAVDYSNAAKSLQVVVLLTGLVVGKGFALWAGAARAFKVQDSSVKIGKEASAECGVRGAESATLNPQPSTINRAHAVLAILILLLAGASQWHPERGMEFQYRGQPRWTGPWDNPNLFGVLMGVGVILAVGLLVSDFRFQVSGPKPEPSNLQSSTLPASHWSRAYRFLFSGFLFSAFVLCAFGLVKSYSRGAWLGTAVGLGVLIWKWFNREPREIREKEIQRDAPLATFGHPLPVGRGERGGAHGVTRPTSQLSRIWRISRFNSDWRPISIILISAFVICFWQFRHTEAPLARRVFSVGNPNDFSWRNRVAAWEGAGRMMLARPIIGFGWGKAEEVYSKEYRAARLEESAAIQMNDYLMIGISAGTPALACLLGYLFLTGFQVSGFKFQVRQAETLDLGLKPLDSMPTICFAGAIVGMVGFWFDGGLFKLPTCVMFWVLVELSRRGGLTTKCPETTKSENEIAWAFFRVFRVFRGSKELSHRPVSGQALPSEPEKEPNSLTAKHTKYAKAEITIRWLAGLFAAVALGLTALHLGTPQFAVSERTLSIARKFLVPPGERNDFEFLAAKNIWANTPLKTLLQHAHLANYNRTLVNWKLDEPMYREFVLSPEVNLQPSTFNLQPPDEFGWRRSLWEYFYPRIRKEGSLEAAAEIVVRNLNELYRRRSAETQTEKAEVRSQTSSMGKSIAEIWQQREASDAEFARLCVAALRSAGIPARLAPAGQTEFWNGAEWKLAPRPPESTREK